MTDEHSSFTRQSIDAADYRNATERFDLLWAAPPSLHAQTEMQQLLALIECYEAAQLTGPVRMRGRLGDFLRTEPDDICSTHDSNASRRSSRLTRQEKLT
jgi:hypothetical protein